MLSVLYLSLRTKSENKQTNTRSNTCLWSSHQKRSDLCTCRDIFDKGKSVCDAHSEAICCSVLQYTVYNTRGQHLLLEQTIWEWRQLTRAGGKVIWDYSGDAIGQGQGWFLEGAHVKPSVMAWSPLTFRLNSGPQVFGEACVISSVFFYVLLSLVDTLLRR